MNKKLLNIAVLLLCYLQTSCLGVFYVDLGNHYAWLENRVVVKIKEETENSLFYDLIVRPQVLNYAYDDRYVGVYQVYDGSEYYNSDQIAEGKDSLLVLFKKQKEMKHCYWIIDKQMNQVMGPMARREFERQCLKLNVMAKMKSFNEKEFMK